jgi:Zn-dependent M28 family amino/carboxypeptidase
MKTIIFLRCILLLCMLNFSVSSFAAGKSCQNRVNNTSKKLLECVTLDGVRAHQAELQIIADINNGSRLSGTEGFNQSVDYFANQLVSAGYEVVVQPFEHITFALLNEPIFQQLTPSSLIYSYPTEFEVMSYSAGGDITNTVTPVDLSLGLGNNATSGCEAADFVGFPAGDIALIQRGACSFRLKAENAATAGASAVIIFNQGNTEARKGPINGTLSQDYQGNIPVVSSSYDVGVSIAGIIGTTANISLDVLVGNITSYNVLAESKGGDETNVVMAGAHLDSVSSGPGINDNGSGSAALLETALQMAKVKPRNKVRFAWWGSEESGLLGSQFYVDQLSAQQAASISLYLNFDMIGSPNYGVFIYDGDDSDAVGFPAGPDGSAAIEKLYEQFYFQRGIAFQGTDFSGRSDYGPFINAGIPAGGLFSGAEGIKTAEQVNLWGGTQGDSFDPCYHVACDTFDNVSLVALDFNADAVAYSVLHFAMNTELVNGKKGKGNFKSKNVMLEYQGSQLQF